MTSNFIVSVAILIVSFCRVLVELQLHALVEVLLSEQKGFKSTPKCLSLKEIFCLEER